jgi:hypothetical protein
VAWRGEGGHQTVAGCPRRYIHSMCRPDATKPRPCDRALRSQAAGPVCRQVAALLAKIRDCHQRLDIVPQFAANLAAPRADQKGSGAGGGRRHCRLTIIRHPPAMPSLRTYAWRVSRHRNTPAGRIRTCAQAPEGSPVWGLIGQTLRSRLAGERMGRRNPPGKTERMRAGDLMVLPAACRVGGGPPSRFPARVHS